MDAWVMGLWQWAGAKRDERSRPRFTKGRGPFAATVLALFTLSPGLAHAVPWHLDPSILGRKMTESLHDKHSDITSAAELTSLLRDIARKKPLLQLEARREGGRWMLHAKSAEVVADLEISLVTRQLRLPLQRKLRQYIGDVASAGLTQKLQTRTSEYLTARGYPQNRVNVNQIRIDGGILYEIDVTEGEPCLISDVRFGFDLPAGVEPGIELGDICDRHAIEDKLSAMETSLRDHGYNQFRMEPPVFDYDPDSNTSVLRVTGVLGQKIRYEVVDESKRFLIDDLFGDEELENIDPTIVGPEAMASELSRRYRNLGFIDVQIRGPTVKRGEDNTTIYRYEVEPGPQYVLKGIEFEGNEVFTRDELLETMGISSVWGTSRPLDLETIKKGLNAIRAKYQDAGYWDAVVRDPGTGQKDQENATVRLSIQIEEGVPRLRRRLVVKGNDAIPSHQIRKLFPPRRGAPVDRAELIDLEQDIRSLYVNRGYLYADVKVTLDSEKKEDKVLTDVIVTVEEGTRVKVGDVTVVGLVDTKHYVVRRELVFEKGDWYDPEDISDTRRALTRLGLFRSVQISPAERNALSRKEAELDMVIEVRESPAGSVGFGPGWSLYQGWRYSTEASYNNLAGTARQVSLRGSISEEKHQTAIGSKTLLGRKLGAGYLEPYLFGWPIDGTITLNHAAQAVPDLWELSYGGEITFSHDLSYGLQGSRVAVFYGQKVSRTEGAKEKEENLVATNVRTGQMGLRYHIDQRNELRFPTGGYTFDSELSWARYQFGGNIRYFKWSASTSKYVGLTDDLVLALGLDVASYSGIQRKGDRVGVLPPSERFYGGGSDSVRGFKPRILGPAARSPSFATRELKQGGREVSYWDCGYQFDPLGGTRKTVLKSELRYRLTESLATTGFLDSGNVFLTPDQMRRFGNVFEAPVDPGNLPADSRCAGRVPRRSVQENVGYRYKDIVKNPGYLWSRHNISYGFGLNFLTALGSINLAYGLPLREPKTEACQENEKLCYERYNRDKHPLLRGEFHLNVGARF